MLRRLAAFLVLALPCAAIPANGMTNAAEPSLRGSIWVDQGAGYAQLSSGTRLAPGTPAMTLDQPATLSFDDGCVVTLPANSMLMRQVGSPCSGVGMIQAADYTTGGPAGFQSRVNDQGYGGGGGGLGGYMPWLIGLGVVADAALITGAVYAAKIAHNGSTQVIVGGTGGSGGPVSP